MVDVIDGSNPDPAKLQVPLAPAIVDVDFLLTLKGVCNLAFDPQRTHDRTGFNNFLELHSIPENVMLQREKSWFASSLRARMQYLGLDLDLPSINEELPKNISLDPSVSPVGAFCLLVLDPKKVDYLNRKTNTRQVFECSRSLNGHRCWTLSYLTLHIGQNVERVDELQLTESFSYFANCVTVGVCKRKAEPSMLDMVLREKRDEITLVTTKGNVQREGTRNGGNVSP
ncbi:hypothetical protein Cgig2_023924 [Carnegiea gigantea]|uniref:Uncharacterized protein n=1 Tax=Carnegiea gigantea TaxID=171969 RepID=A0A9Q1JQ91_9CARY|nr:hypothetical protein Cgig2_023924 [Carnegiea gigantea]